MFGSDLSFQFRIFGIQAQVSLFFLILAVVIGPRSEPGLMVAWVAIVFVSVLLHELGHALSARAFGQQPFIMLYGLGGVTMWRQTEELPAGRRFLIALAGPGIGIVIGSMALLVLLALPNGTVADRVTGYVVFANLGWGILNLIPMLPLDGGKIMAALFDVVAPGSGARGARYASIVTAILVIPLALYLRMFLLVLYCGLAIWSNIQELRQPPPPPASEAVIEVPAQAVSNDVTPPRDERPS